MKTEYTVPNNLISFYHLHFKMHNSAFVQVITLIRNLAIGDSGFFSLINYSKKNMIMLFVWG